MEGMMVLPKARHLEEGMARRWDHWIEGVMGLLMAHHLEKTTAYQKQYLLESQR
jgi:hypothetical protein